MNAIRYATETFGYFDSQKFREDTMRRWGNFVIKSALYAKDSGTSYT